MDFSIPMALTDYIPVLCFTIAAIIFLRAFHNKMTAAAFALFATGVLDVTCAGALKATYKLLYAANVCDFQPLTAMFFPVQSLGFLFAGVGMLLMLLQKKKVTLSAAAPTLFTGTFVFVGLMVAGLGVMDTVFCILCKKLKKNWVMVLFILSFLCSLCMGYLSSRDFTEAAMNWIAQGVNMVGQGCFLAGALCLRKAGLSELEL